MRLINDTLRLNLTKLLIQLRTIRSHFVLKLTTRIVPRAIFVHRPKCIDWRQCIFCNSVIMLLDNRSMHLLGGSTTMARNLLLTQDPSYWVGKARSLVSHDVRPSRHDSCWPNLRINTLAPTYRLIVPPRPSAGHFVSTQFLFSKFLLVKSNSKWSRIWQGAIIHRR